MFSSISEIPLISKAIHSLFKSSDVRRAILVIDCVNVLCIGR